MKFRSIKEYFYKLNTIGFILLLLPLVAFIYLYYQPIDRRPIITELQSEIILLSALTIIFLIDLTIVHWVWSAKIQRLQTLSELARKMDGYFSLALFKMASYCGCSLLMAAGFFLTGNSLFTVLFLIIVITLTFQWPSSTSFCRHFDLRGSERDMILNNRDLYQKKKRTAQN